MGEFTCGMEAAKMLGRRFIQEYGSILCPQIQSRIFGRSFNLQYPADWQAFLDAGAHTDPTKCMSIVGNAARWALEILIDTKAVSL
jgi:hypothetical protein